MKKLKAFLTSKAFINRVKSFLWRTGAILGVAFISFSVQEVSTLELPGWLVVVIGLVTGEITKALNNLASKNEY